MHAAKQEANGDLPVMTFDRTCSGLFIMPPIFSSRFRIGMVVPHWKPDAQMVVDASFFYPKGERGMPQRPWACHLIFARSYLHERYHEMLYWHIRKLVPLCHYQ